MVRGQAAGVLLRELQEVEGDALRRLGADAGETAELVDEVLDREGVVRHPAPPNRSPRPPRSGKPPSAPSCARALHLAHLGHGVVQGGQHQVLRHLDVGGVDDLGVDGDRREVAAARDADLHHAAARHAFEDGGRGLGLRLHQLLLHLAGEVEQRAEVEPAAERTEVAEPLDRVVEVVVEVVARRAGHGRGEHGVGGGVDVVVGIGHRGSPGEVAGSRPVGASVRGTISAPGNASASRSTWERLSAGASSRSWTLPISEASWTSAASSVARCSPGVGVASAARRAGAAPSSTTRRRGTGRPKWRSRAASTSAPLLLALLAVRPRSRARTPRWCGVESRKRPAE